MITNLMIGDNVTNELNHNIINLFPVSIHQFDVNRFDKVKDELIDYVYAVSYTHLTLPTSDLV